QVRRELCRLRRGGLWLLQGLGRDRLHGRAGGGENRLDRLGTLEPIRAVPDSCIVLAFVMSPRKPDEIPESPGVDARLLRKDFRSTGQPEALPPSNQPLAEQVKFLSRGTSVEDQPEVIAAVPV